MNHEARTLFCSLETLLPTPDQLASFQTMLAAILTADGNPRPAHAPAKGPGALSRFVNQYGWNARSLIWTVWHAILERVEAIAQQYRGRKPILEISIDGTCLEKTGVFERLEIRLLNDKIDLHLVVPYVVLGNQRFPWAFSIWRGKDTRSPAQLALRILARLPHVARLVSSASAGGRGLRLGRVHPRRSRPRL